MFGVSDCFYLFIYFRFVGNISILDIVCGVKRSIHLYDKVACEWRIMVELERVDVDEALFVKDYKEVTVDRELAVNVLCTEKESELMSFIQSINKTKNNASDSRRSLQII